MPWRSISQPKNGVMIGEATALASSPAENSPRVQPSSVVTGSMKTLVTKITAGPGPTILPISDPQTIHHRLAKRPARGAALVADMFPPFSLRLHSYSARMRGACTTGGIYKLDHHAGRPFARFGAGCRLFHLVFARAPHACIVSFERELARAIARFFLRHDVLHAA